MGKAPLLDATAQNGGTPQRVKSDGVSFSEPIGCGWEGPKKERCSDVRHEQTRETDRRTSEPQTQVPHQVICGFSYEAFDLMEIQLTDHMNVQSN